MSCHAMLTRYLRLWGWHPSWFFDSTQTVRWLSCSWWPPGHGTRWWDTAAAAAAGSRSPPDWPSQTPAATETPCSSADAQLAVHISYTFTFRHEQTSIYRSEFVYKRSLLHCPSDSQTLGPCLFFLFLFQFLTFYILQQTNPDPEMLTSEKTVCRGTLYLPSYIPPVIPQGL